MQCNKCGQKAVYQQTNQGLCKDHFLGYFENKVFKTIRQYELFQPGDKVCVAASGGKDSLSVLYLTLKFCKQHHIHFFALAIDEGISGYRDHTLKDLEHFCTMYGIALHTVSFKEKIGATLD